MMKKGAKVWCFIVILVVLFAIHSLCFVVMAGGVGVDGCLFGDQNIGKVEDLHSNSYQPKGTNSKIITLLSTFEKGNIIEARSFLDVCDNPDGAVLILKSEGDKGMILRGPEESSGNNWWFIRWEKESSEGWSKENQLRKKNIYPSAKFSIDDQVEVCDSKGLDVRTDPPDLARKGSVGEGAKGIIIDGPRYGIPKDHVSEEKRILYHLWKVKFESITGWCAEGWPYPGGVAYLKKVESPGIKSTKFKTGDFVRVIADAGWNIRTEPKLGEGYIIAPPSPLQKGSEGQVMEHQDNGVFNDGYYWWYLRFGDCEGWCAEDGLDQPPICAIELYWLAKVIASEAGSVWDVDHWARCTEEERSAVGWTVLNRLESGEHGETIKDVVTERGQYAYDKESTSEIIELAKDLLNGQIPDSTEGASHFFSPISMKSGYGPYKIPETNKVSYIPSWTIPKGYSKTSPPHSDWEMTECYKTIENLEWVSGLEDIRNWYFMFYRPIGSPSVAKPVLTSPLKITPEKDKYYVGDTLTAQFTITNKGTQPITFDKLTVGGQLNGECPDNKCPDFTFRSTALQPNVPYQYTGTLTLTRSGNYHFFIAFYIENPTSEEKKLLDENNWNTGVDLGEGLTLTNRIKNIIVFEKEISPPDAISELRDSINHRLRQPVKYPPYLLDPNSFTSAVATVWGKFTSWITQTHLTERYDELYQTGIDYDCLSFKALKNARDFLDRGDIVSAKKYLQKSYTYEKLSAMSFGAAAEVFDNNLEAGETLAKGIKTGCEASVKFGLSVTNPEAAKAADYIYIGIDYAIDRALVGKEQAAKNAIIQTAVTTIFNEIKFKDLDGRTIADYTENRIGKVTFPMLQKAFQNNEQVQFALSKIIKECGVALEEEAAEYLLSSIQDELEKAVNLKQIEVKSPVELQVYDSQGQATGLLKGDVEHGISRSVYCDGIVTILFPLDTYRYEVIGTDTGTYGLAISSLEDGDAISFTATDIPTTVGAIHQYTIDWAALSQGEKGVTVKMDSDGDGVFEKTVIADNELSQEELTPTLPVHNTNTGESFSTIQAAVDAANTGDTIIVRDGTYTENVDIDKSITLKSSSGNLKNTIVQAANPNDHVFEITADYVNIRGFTVGGVAVCIFLNEVNYCNISNNHILNYTGIYLNYSNDNIIMNNNFSKSDDGILLDSSNSNTVFNNTFSGYNLYSLGIGLKNSTNNLISDNTICNCPHGGIELGFASSNNIILNNTFKSCGLCVWRYEKNTVKGNTVNDKPLIYLEHVSQIEINNAGQVILANCEHIKVIGCNLSSASIGIDLLNSSNCVIENNICRDNFCGGIDLFDDSSNNIVLNNIIGNNFWGIFLTSYASNNTIVNNICENNYIGIDLSDTNNNRIYLNNLNNDCNVQSYDSCNIWNSKEKITYSYNGKSHTKYLGNYWSDYTGSDANNNGIGDSPYSIDDRGGDIDQDYYPLMTWSDHYFNSLPHPLPLPPPTSTLTPAPRPTLTLTPRPTLTLAPRPTPTLAPRPTLRPTATLFEKIEGLIAAIRVGVGI